jgi:hypothetical protein
MTNTTTFDFDGPADTGSDPVDDYAAHMNGRGFWCDECGEWTELGDAARSLCIVCIDDAA